MRGDTYHTNQEALQRRYEIELPQSVIDSLYLKSRNSMQANRDRRNWKNRKRSILIKVRSAVKFKDDMRKDAPIGASFFVAIIGRKALFRRDVPLIWGWVGVLPARSYWVRCVLRRTCSMIRKDVVFHDTFKRARVSLFVTPYTARKGGCVLEYLQKSPEDAKPQNVILCSMGMGYNP